MRSDSRNRRAPVERWLVGLAVVLLAALLTSAPASAASYAVQIQGYAYSPASLSIHTGDTVTWTNHDTAQHDVTVTSGPTSFKSPLLAQGQSWSFTFATAGSYSYICSVHPDMKATITVAPAAPAPAPVAAAPTVAAAAPSHKTTTMVMPAQTPAAAASTAPSVAADAPPVVAPAATTSPASESFNPLLLVGGAVLAVLVFCLVLMASRPDVPAPAAAATAAAEPEPTSVLAAVPPLPPASGEAHEGGA